MSEQRIRDLATKACTLFQQHGGTKYTLDYRGANDSTDGCDSTIEPADLTQFFSELQVSYNVGNSEWVNGKVVSGWHDKTSSFEDLVYELANALWQFAGQGGWYNNEGGYGEVILYPGGFVEFRHVNYLNDGYEYDDEGNEIGEAEQEEQEECHWRFNILAGPINVPYEEPVPA